MQYTQAEKIMLENVNKIGRHMKASDDDFIFIQLSSYLDNLMAFLKRLFAQYAYLFKKFMMILVKNAIND